MNKTPKCPNCNSEYCETTVEYIRSPMTWAVYKAYRYKCLQCTKEFIK